MQQILELLKLVSEGNDEILQLVNDFMKQSSERDHLMKTCLTLYKNEVMDTSKVVPSMLAAEQIETIVNELKILQDICNMGIRSGKNELIKPSLFKDFSCAVEERCPLLKNIIETLVVSNAHERNTYKTNEKKLLCGHHALALLLNVRNSNCCNDMPLLFGLLCISYGAGKQFINMLQSIGLSLHFSTM